MIVGHPIEKDDCPIKRDDRSINKDDVNYHLFI